MNRYELSYTLAPEMQNRAMMSWAKPAPNSSQRRWGIVWKLVGFVVGVIFFVALLQFDVVTGKLLLSAAVGFYLALLLWIITYRRSVAKLTGYANEALLRQGRVCATFSPQGLTFKADLSASTMDWRSIDDVLSINGATVLREGALVFALPDDALPADVMPEAFRADLIRWMEGAK